MKLTIFYVFLILMLSQVDGKKKKQKINIKYPEFSSHKRPTDIEPLLYCESCRGIIWLMIKSLRGSTKEVDIVEVID